MIIMVMYAVNVDGDTVHFGRIVGLLTQNKKRVSIASVANQFSPWPPE
jgi:hypothetical protein